MSNTQQVYAYAAIEAGQIIQYPIWEGDLKLSVNYDETQGEFTPPDGYVTVYDVVPPESPTDQKQILIEGTPELINGNWIRKWIIRDLTPEELEVKTKLLAERIRRQRNQLLLDTDWTQLSDSPADGSAWVSYRQSLRDISMQPEFPWEVEWPNPPV